MNALVELTSVVDGAKTLCPWPPMAIPTTYHSLDKLHPLLSDLVNVAKDVYHLLLLNLFQDAVDGDESTCATDAGATRERNGPMNKSS